VEDGCKTRKKQFRQLLRNEYGPQVHADPPIGQKQRRPMDGAQFHSPWAGFAGGGLKSGLRPVINWITSTTNAITSKM
jgi:hypothetical protein